MSPWFLLFFLTPIVEMYLLLQVGGYFGAPITIALVMLTAVIGVALLRRQGLATLTRGQQRLAAGQLPAAEMAEGLLLAVAGPLLLTPGFLTDAAGFTLLIPAVRRMLSASIAQRFQVVNTGAEFRTSGQMPPRSNQPADVIEGEFERREPPD